MIAVLLVIGSALCITIDNYIFKKYTNIAPVSIAARRMFIAFILMLPLFLLNISDPPIEFYFLAFISASLFAYVNIYYIKAVNISGISNTAPMLSLTPALVLLLGIPTLGEVPTLIKGIGVAISVSGLFVFAYSKGFRIEKGSLIMISIAIVFAIDGIIFKVLIVMSNIYYAYAICLLFCMSILNIKNHYSIKTVSCSAKMSILLGITLVSMTLLAGFALEYMYVVYVTLLKRLAIIFSMIVGVIVFKERLSKNKLLGTILMLSGMGIVII